MPASPDDTARRRWAARGISLLAGAVVPLGFSPVGFWPLVPVSLAVLIVLCHGTARSRAFALGWWFGLGLFGIGVSWVYISIHEFGNAWGPAAVLATAGLAATLAVFIATAAALAAATARRGAVFCLGVFPAAWVVLEWVRSWLLTGFPWLNLGASQTDAWTAGFVPVLGVYGVSLLLAFVAGALAFAWLAGARRALPALALAAAVFPAGWAAGLADWTRSDGPRLEAALLQGNFGQDIKWERAWLRPQLEWYAARTREHLDADIVLWPETALPAFYHQLRVPYFSTLAEAGRDAGTSILAGTLYGEDEAFNAIVGVGAAEGVYRKIHLVPLGEFFPFKPLVRFLMPGLDIPMSDMSAGGRDQPALKVAGREVAPIICYEDAFGELTRRLLPAAGMLVSVSNDGWFGDSFAAHQHLQIARMRALETGRPMLRATNTGISAIIDHRGRVSDSLAQFEQGVLRGGVRMRTGATPFVRFGYAPVLLLSMLVLLGAAFSTASSRID